MLPNMNRHINRSYFALFILQTKSNQQNKEKIRFINNIAHSSVRVYSQQQKTSLFNILHFRQNIYSLKIYMSIVGEMLRRHEKTTTTLMYVVHSCSHVEYIYK